MAAQPTRQALVAMDSLALAAAATAIRQAAALALRVESIRPRRAALTAAVAVAAAVSDRTAPLAATVACTAAVPALGEVLLVRKA